MRMRAKRVFFVVVLVIFVLTIVRSILLTQAEKALVSNLQKLTSQTVSIKTLIYQFPATLHIKDLEIGGRKDQRYLFIDQASLSLALLKSLLNRQLIFTHIRIIHPRLFYEREAGQRMPLPGSGAVGFIPLAKRFEIVNGTIEFIDRKLAVKKLGITVAGLNCFMIRNVNNRGAGVVEFSGYSGVLLGEHSPLGQATINGWADLASRTMQAKVGVRNIDGIYLYPYYSEWINFEKARFQKAQFDFSAEVAGKENTFDASCRLELTQSEFEPLPSGQSPRQPQKLAMLVIEILKALDKGRASVDFNLKFDADKPDIDWTPLSEAFAEKMHKGIVIKPAEVKDALKLPENVVRNTVVKLESITKNVLNQTLELGQALQQSIQDTFIKITPKRVD